MEDMTMTLAMTSNNAYDTIILIDGNRIVSRWDATPESVREYMTATNASDWDVQDVDGLKGDDGETPLTVSDFGREIGRDGKITDAERLEFWTR
jgi:hypothetical protein